MTNKIQKIREEVEKLKSNLLYGACSSQVAMETRCKEEAYNEVLAILDTMQEEPKSKFEQSIQEGDNIVYNEDLGFRVNLSLLDRVAKKEEPVSDDLAAEVEKYLEAHIAGDYCIERDSLKIWGRGIAYYFADWKKEQMMANAVDVTIAIPYQNSEGGYTQLVDSKKGLPFGDNIKVLVIKEENIWKQKKEQ